MCGRFALRANRHEIEHQPGNDLDIDDWENEDEFRPRYNIAPRTQAPVVRRRDPGPSASASSGNGHELVLQTMKWGLVPHWSKVEDNTLNTINARAENLIEGGGMWASIKGKNRCAVPCQGYYEWLTKGKDKLPYFTKRKDGNLLLMAGLYDSAVIEGRTIWTFAIVTTNANKEFSWLHDRQPVFLTSKPALDKWLDTSSRTWTPELTELVQPYHDSVTLECYQVPKEVGKVGTESPTFIEPVASRKDGIQAMFTKQQQSKTSTASKSISPSPQKEKRSRSPTPIDMEGDEPKNKKARLKVTEEDGKAPTTGSKIKVEEKSKPQRSTPKKQSPTKPKHSPKKPSTTATGSAKITSFFNKGK